MSAESRREAKKVFRSLELGVLLAMCCVGTARCEELPDAPEAPVTPKIQVHKVVSVETPRERQIRHAELVGVALANVGDWVTTQQCVHSTNCHEAILPDALARSGWGLAAFMGGKVFLEWKMSDKLARKHPKLAIVADGINMLSVAATVGHNASILNSHGSSAALPSDPRSIERVRKLR